MQFIELLKQLHSAKKFIGGRRSGKTHNSIKYCVDNQIIIVCHSFDFERYLRHEYRVPMELLQKNPHKKNIHIEEIGMFDIKELDKLLSNGNTIVSFSGTIPQLDFHKTLDANYGDIDITKFPHYKEEFLCEFE